MEDDKCWWTFSVGGRLVLETASVGGWLVLEDGKCWRTASVGGQLVLEDG
jgi:hypothetical protein